MDCSGQDDINAKDERLEHYPAGSDVVYGVLSKRDTATFFMRFTAECFYKFFNVMGAGVENS